jgi:hypothetical protein
MTNSTHNGSRARPHAKDLPDRLAELAEEADLVSVRSKLVREVGETIKQALEHERTYVDKAGEMQSYAQPEFSAAMKGWELLGRWLLLDPDELIERSEKVRRAFERGGKKAA